MASIVFLCFFFLLSSPALAFNITTILAQYPDFSTFNSYLSQTGVAAAINHRATITVLAVDNGAAGAFSGKPMDEVDHVLSVHVILDYYDMDRLSKLSNNSAILTTLFQTSGVATNQMGFLNVTVDKSSRVISLASAVPGSATAATVLKTVTSQPYDVSVLQVSSVIFPTGIDKVNTTTAPPSKAPAPKSPVSPAAAPTPSTKRAPSPPPPAPSGDIPTGAPAPAPAPADDDGGDDASSPGPSDENSGASRRAAASCVGAVAGLLCMAAAL